jgi:hypothetical protein
MYLKIKNIHKCKVIGYAANIMSRSNPDLQTSTPTNACTEIVSSSWRYLKCYEENNNKLLENRGRNNAMSEQ